MRRNGVIWGLILLSAGLLLLLDNLGYLRFLGVSVWQILWPLAFIALGLWILLGSRLRGDGETETLHLPLEGATGAEVRVDYGAGELRIDGGGAPDALADGTFESGVHHDVRHRNGHAILQLRSPSLMVGPWVWTQPPRRRWDLHLNEQIPLSLTVHSGASDCRLNLEQLKVTYLDIQSGASSLNVILPAHAGLTEVRVSTGAASIDMQVPEGVAARISVKGALSSTSVDRARFPRQRDGRYVSPNYDTATDRVDIRVETGVGAFTIR